MKNAIRCLLCFLVLSLLLFRGPVNAFAADPDGSGRDTQIDEPTPESNNTAIDIGQNPGSDPPPQTGNAAAESNVVFDSDGELAGEVPGKNAISTSQINSAKLGGSGENTAAEGTTVKVRGDPATVENEGAGNTKDDSSGQSTGDQDFLKQAPEDPAAEPARLTGSTNDSEPGESSEDDEDEGNLTAEKEGIILEGSGEFDVLVEGTLKSGEVPILISNEVTPNNVTITVWEIESPVEVSGEEHVVLEETAEGADPEVTEDSKKIEENIYYIIKIEPSKANISLCKEDGDHLDEKHGYEVAQENHTVVMKVSVPDGYHLKGAWRDDDKQISIKPEDNGNYLITVFRGGGVYLSVELDKDDDDDDDDDGGYVFCIPVPCTPCCCECSGEDFEIVFDLNGGELNGDSGPIRFQKKCGESMQLLEAPVRPGYRFVCWATSPKCSCVKASAPGETFTVKCDVTFIAVWEAIDSAAPNADDGDGDDDDDDDDDDDEDVTQTVEIHATGGETIEREIGGSIKVENDPAKGVSIDAMGSGDSAVELEVGGKIEVKGKEQGAVGVSVQTDGVKLKADVEAEGGMTVKSDGSSTGIQASASNGGNLAVELEGNVDVSSSTGNSVGVTVTAYPACSATVEVEGNLKSDGKGAILHTDNGRAELRIGEDKEAS